MHPMNEVKQSLVRVAILNEMGLGPVWAQRFPDVEVIESQPTQSQKLAPEMTGEPDIAPSSNSDIHYEDVVQTDSISTHEAAPEEIRANVPLISSLGWAELEATVSACQACGLCKARQNTVFGVGERAATWLFVGEGPGYHEDLHGEPFIGAAGQLLDNMLLAMGVKRGDRSYIANVVKCRAEDEAGKDRPPSADEIAACLPYLQRQILSSTRQWHNYGAKFTKSGVSRWWRPIILRICFVSLLRKVKPGRTYVWLSAPWMVVSSELVFAKTISR